MRIPFSIPAAGSAAFDTVGFGLNSLDLVAVVPEFPEPNTKVRLQRFARMPGGQVATAMVACARLGWSARYVGSFGGDEFGAISRQSLVDEAVDVSEARTVAGATNEFAVILVDSRSGDRTILWDRHPALTMPPAAVPKAAVTSGRMLLVDALEIPATAQAARWAREAGVATVLDAETVRAGIDDLLRHIDAIIVAESFPIALTGHEQLGKALEAMAREFQAPLVCVTLGEAGSLAYCGGREIRTPGFPIDAADSTGAGDAFRGGFIAGCLLNPNGQIEDALRYANAVAALNCRALGARPALPKRGEVESLLATRGKA